LVWASIDSRSARAAENTTLAASALRVAVIADHGPDYRDAGGAGKQCRVMTFGRC
jgi:hypothetical protein